MFQRAPGYRYGHTWRMQKLSLKALAREQLAAAASTSSGRSSRTVYGGQEHVLRQTVIALNAGSSMSEHDNQGDSTIFVLSGRVRLTSGTINWEARESDLLMIPEARHSLLAVETSSILLTWAAHPAKGSARADNGDSAAPRGGPASTCSGAQQDHSADSVLT